MSLDSAPAEVKLAVDLIMLLEQNQIPPQVVLSALEIVRHDYLIRQENEENGTTPAR